MEGVNGVQDDVVDSARLARVGVVGYGALIHLSGKETQHAIDRSGAAR